MNPIPAAPRSAASVLAGAVNVFALLGWAVLLCAAFAYFMAPLPAHFYALAVVCELICASEVVQIMIGVLRGRLALGVILQATALLWFCMLVYQALLVGGGLAIRSMTRSRVWPLLWTVALLVALSIFFSAVLEPTLLGLALPAFAAAQGTSLDLVPRMDRFPLTPGHTQVSVHRYPDGETLAVGCHVPKDRGII